MNRELSGYVSQPDGTVQLKEKTFSVLQTGFKLYHIFKEKLVYLKKYYKTILINVKKGIESICDTLANT